MGRPRRGLALGLIVGLTFLVGVLLHGTLPRPVAGQPFSWLGAAASAATGLLAATAWALGASRGTPTSTSEAGSAFLLTAGIMSLLLLLDAFERGRGRTP